MAERFTRWNEPKSGINPFVPHRRKWPHNLVGRCVKGVVGLALAVLRLPIVLVLFACLAVTSLLMKLVYVKALQRLLKFLLESPLCYLSLLFLGFYSPRSTVVDRRRVHLAEDKKSKRSKNPRGGDLIIANSSSFVDILYMGYRFCPTFVRSTIHGGLEEVTLFTALLAAFGPVSTSRLATPIDTVFQSARGFLAGPVCYQPETARSNGRAVLRFSAAMRTLGDAIAAMPAESRPHTHTLVIKYPFKYFSSTHTADRPWSHMLWMCTQVFNRVHAVRLPPTVDPQPSSVTPGDKWSDACRNAMVEALGGGVRAVEFGPGDFNEFWFAFRNPSTRTQKRVRTYHGDIPVEEHERLQAAAAASGASTRKRTTGGKKGN